MSFKQMFRDCVKMTPRFVHSLLTWGKIKSLEAMLLSPKVVTASEHNYVTKEQIVKQAIKKHRKKAERVIQKINQTIAEASCLEGATDKNYLRLDMLFCYFAYGYIPEEYALYRFDIHTNESYRRQFISEITRLCCRFAMNDFSESTCSNKATEYERLKEFYKRDAVVIRGEEDRNNFVGFAQNNKRFIEKATSSSMGKGVRIVDLAEDSISPEDYFNERVGSGTWLIEQVIRQSRALAAFNTSSVNTCRLASFMTNNGVLVPWGFMRSGRKGQHVDNAHHGGIFIAVDTNSGKLIGEAMDIHGNTYVAHPESGILFCGYQLPEWDKAVELVKRAAKYIPKVRYASWDLAHTEDNGWVVVEVNPSGQFLWQPSTHEGCKNELRAIMSQMDLIVDYQLK